MIKDIDRIVWPEARHWAASWNEYLYLGFLNLGLNVERTESLCDAIPGISGNLRFDIIWEAGEHQRIWYDISDFPKHCYVNAAKGNDLYFKIQLRREDARYERMYPIGQVTTRANFHNEILPELRVMQKKREFAYDVIGVFRPTNYSLRIKALEIVKSRAWRSLVAIEPCINRGPIPENIKGRKLDYQKHLRFQCRSKICLDFPGVGGEWAWRFTEILGMGCFCLRTEPLYACPGNPQNCWGEVKRDLSDLAEKIDYYLVNDEARDEIAKNGMEYYEKFLSPVAQAKYLLDIARRNQ